MRVVAPVLVLAIALGLGCGKTNHNGSLAAERGDGGGAGIAAPEPDPCDAANAYRIWGKPYDAERDCIDTEHPVADVACTLQPEQGDDPDYSDGNVCLQSKTDGTRVWVFAYNRVGFRSSVWVRCPDAPPIAPKGCYAAGCPSAPRSTCSLEQTQRMFNCGPESEYDENCCGRISCKTDDDCSDDEACVSFETLGQWYCWDSPANACDCGGPPGGSPQLRCAPKSAGNAAAGAGGFGG